MRGHEGMFDLPVAALSRSMIVCATKRWASLRLILAVKRSSVVIVGANRARICRVAVSHCWKKGICGESMVVPERRWAGGRKKRNRI